MSQSVHTVHADAGQNRADRVGDLVYSDGTAVAVKCDDSPVQHILQVTGEAENMPMTLDFLSHLKALPPATLEPIVCNALSARDVELLDWHCQPLARGAAGYILGGHGPYRFEGLARCAGEIQPWSTVLKVAGSGGRSASDDATQPEYWKRETELYQSGFLRDLPPGLSTPRCYGVVPLSEREIWLWLEDIPQPADNWTPERYGLAAMHLGQFNGAYLMGHPLPPNANWLLAGGRTPGWVAGAESRLNELDAFIETRMGQRWLQATDRNRVTRLYANRQALLQALARLPRCLCHHDAFRRNLLDRRAADGRVETIGIDWAYVGYGGVGQEIAMTTAVTLLWLDVAANQATTLNEIIFEGYMAGLRDVGWQGDARLARLGYTATVGLVWGMAWPTFMSRMLGEVQAAAALEDVIGHSADEIMDQWREVQPLIFSMGEEALTLAQIL